MRLFVMMTVDAKKNLLECLKIMNTCTVLLYSL